MLEYELLSELESLEALAPEWDALAVANALPLMAPAWIISWWRHLAPPSAEPRVVVVRDRDGLIIGVAPFYLSRSARFGRLDYRLPGIELASRLSPLAAPGREWEVAGTTAHALAHAEPRPDLVALESVPPASAWLTAMRDQWPGRIRPAARLYNVHTSPTVTLNDRSFEAWLAGRSAKFRSNYRRRRRMFTEAGGTMRLSTRSSLNADVATLMRLHTERWRGLGASSLVTRAEGVKALLNAAGQALTESGRFRIWVMEIEGEPIWANLFLGAGGELLGINGGWDERRRALSPPLLGMVHAIEDAFGRGDRRLDLGVGDASHKLQFADSDDPIGWWVLMPPSRRQALTLMRTGPMLLRSALREKALRTLKPDQIDHVRDLRRKLSG